jgi:hypothetical protein
MIHMIRRRAALLTLALLGSACTTVPATLAATASEPAFEPAPSVAARPPSPDAIEAASLHGMQALETTSIFDGETELQIPSNFVAIHPFGASHVTFEFETSSAKPEGQRKLPGAWEGQLNRWARKNSSAVDMVAELQTAVANRPSWSLGPAGCDDDRGECYVQEASKRWIETTYDEDRASAQVVLEIGGSAEESGPARIMLVTTLLRGAYVYGLIYEVQLDQWETNEALLRASAASFDAHPNSP